MQIHIAKTQGFCAGVSYAINIVQTALDKYGPPLFVFHEIVHNTHVVEDFKQKGVIFVENVREVPLGERIIFSAHGVSPMEYSLAKERGLTIIDATCPLVNKVHQQALKFSEDNYHTILIGHKGHQEVIGTSGYVKQALLHIVENEKDIDELVIPPDVKIGYVTQTTLSVDETKAMVDRLKMKFPNLEMRPLTDLCYATQNRQNAVKELAAVCDAIVICGSPNSSNSNRLREIGEKCGVPSFIVDNAEELDIAVLKDHSVIGVSSGASVPGIVVESLISRIQKAFPGTCVHKTENPERNIIFQLPKI
jgi:4-hydroxy-3-methylbut-2-enyl diphosphate reductase